MQGMIKLQTQNMDSGGLEKKLARFSDFIASHNGVNPVIIENGGDIADAMIILGATSRRHARGLADGLCRLCHENEYPYASMEGYDVADWILLDCSDVIIHIFQSEIRDLYKLENLWTHQAQKENIK